MSAPKVFISYSWSSPEHESWVLNLATELRESGVDAILDKWDLKEGHDTIAFMEKMVSDPTIKKVLMVCDRLYVSKANNRNGGVGTEAQIISKEVYTQQDQSKFVALVLEKDENNKFCVPVYYSSRIFIDFTESSSYIDSFEKLIRWVYDKPVHKKPKLGEKPSFLSNDNGISFGTTILYKRCLDAIKNHKPYAAGAFDEFCGVFEANINNLNISEYHGELDEEIVNKISLFLPCRNEIIQLLIAIAQYRPEEEFIRRVHRLLERMLSYTVSNDQSADHFNFITHELFLYSVAIMIKYERFNQAAYLLQNQYLLDNKRSGRQEAIGSFIEFRGYMYSLENRNKRLKLNRMSLWADMLKERCHGTVIEFIDLMQTDFVAFIRADLQTNDVYSRWWAETLVYIGHRYHPFEIFTRAISKQYFDNIKVLLGINSPNDLSMLMESYKTERLSTPRWGFNTVSPRNLLGYEKLATMP